MFKFRSLLLLICAGAIVVIYKNRSSQIAPNYSELNQSDDSSVSDDQTNDRSDPSKRKNNRRPVTSGNSSESLNVPEIKNFEDNAASEASVSLKSPSDVTANEAEGEVEVPEAKSRSAVTPPQEWKLVFEEDFEQANWLKKHVKSRNRVDPKFRFARRVRGKQSKSFVLQVDYFKGEVGLQNSGAAARFYLSEVSDQAKIEYDVYFVPPFDFRLGGKLPGLGGGGQQEDPRKFVAGGYKPDGTNGWSSRVMWRAQGLGQNYVYHVNQPGTYGHQLNWRVDKTPVTFEEGRWFRITQIVKMNHPSKADGEVQTWLDGLKVLDHRKLRFRSVPRIKIDSLAFSTFFGGETAEWAPEWDSKIWFDNIKVSIIPK